MLIHCHPDPNSFVAGVTERARTALEGAGHDVRFRDLYAEGFDPCFSAIERARHLDSGIDPSIAEHALDLQWCDTLVLSYPTWWSGQPAMLKGWFDRVWVRGVAWDLPDGSNRLTAQLRNVKRIVVLTTHGSPKWVNSIEGESGKRTVTRALRMLCHPRCRTRWIAMYGIDSSTAEQRSDFLDRIDASVAAL